MRVIVIKHPWDNERNVKAFINRLNEDDVEVELKNWNSTEEVEAQYEELKMRGIPEVEILDEIKIACKHLGRKYGVFVD